MKRMTILALLFLGCNLLAQETLTVKEFLSRKDAAETCYAVEGVYVDVVDKMSGIDFVLKDKTGNMRVQLARNGIKTDLAFRSMDIRPGDSLRVVGFRERVSVLGHGTKKGMIMASIQTKSNSREHDDILYRVHPSFMGKGAYAFSEWVDSQLVYPSDMLKWRREGSVVLSFSIEEDGRVSDVEIAQSSGHESFDQEAIRVVSSSPPWLPGMENGKPRKVERFLFPVYFRVNHRPPGK